ncbi:Vacuolar protein sorting-associated protein 32-like 1, partial [Cucurbita argyrosperma subsp. sororia]
MGKVHGSLARAGKVRGQTPKVAKQDKKKKPRGRAHKRMQYNRRFVTAVVGFGKKRGPNSSENSPISDHQFSEVRRSESNALATLDKLNETLEMLEKKENVLLKKAATEVEKAKDYTRAKNKRAAIQCLKRKRLYEQQIEQLGNFQLRIHDQMILLEGAKATTETVDALRTGAAAMKAMQKATNIDDVDKTMDEINEQTENMKQIQEALSNPIGAAADFDEDELEAELEELEGAELEEQLLQPATTAPVAPIPLCKLRWHFDLVSVMVLKQGGTA